MDLNTAQRILCEDALKHLFKCEQEGRRPSVSSVAGTLGIPADQAAALLEEMVAHHLLQMHGGEFELLEAGRDYALQVIRAHRLWEVYLADKTGFPQTEWHARADREEHHLSPEATDALSASLGHPTYDPDGDPIPPPSGVFAVHEDRPLATLEPGQSGRIVHLEDEPPAVYAQLAAEGLAPGMNVEMLEVAPQRVRFRAEGAEIVLAPVVAANITVVPIRLTAKAPTSGEPLSDLKSGEQGRVVNLSPLCRGPERRRMMDLGILPGALITVEMRSPLGDPTAYRIRGATIALRREQANLIHIERSARAAGDR